VVLPVLLSVAIGGVLPSPAPSPTSTPVQSQFYPTIIHTRTSASCTTLRKLLTPVGFVARRNDDAFRAMAFSVQKFLSGIDPADVPSLGELQAAQDVADPSTGAEADQIDQGTSDDTLLYGPSQVLDAARIDRVANQIFANIVLEDSYMNQSWKDYPHGSDPVVDALRQHAQNLIDLQRALADRYEAFAERYLSNQDMAAQRDPTEREYFKLYLRALLLGQVGELTQGGSQVPDEGYLTTSQRARLGSVATVVQDLRTQEREWAAAYLSTYNVCNGTHYVIVAPSPSRAPR
jgi:hypothetical protein